MQRVLQYLFRPLLEAIKVTTQDLSAKLDQFIARENALDTAIQALKQAVVDAQTANQTVPQEIVDKVNTLDAAFTKVETDVAPPAAS